MDQAVTRVSVWYGQFMRLLNPGQGGALWVGDKAEWLITTPGIVNTFHQAVLAYTEPGDGVIC